MACFFFELGGSRYAPLRVPPLRYGMTTRRNITKAQTSNSKPQTPNIKPQTPNIKPQTANIKPQTNHIFTP